MRSARVAGVDLPEGYTYRPATPADVADCCALVVAVDVEEYGAPDYEESDVVDDWARDRFSLSTDTWLVHGPDGALAGYATAWDKSPHTLMIGELAVHPSAPDLYPWLVAALTQRAREHAAESGRCVAHIYNSEPNLRRAAALRDAGYEPVRVFRRMVRPLSSVPAPAPVPGVEIRRVVPDDLPAAWATMHASFADHYDFVPMEYEPWRKAFVESASYRPEHWWLAESDGAVVGILVGQVHEESGWVKTVGTLSSVRGRGVGTALLLTAFAAFREAGFSTVGLGVDSDNTTGAMALYERLGMTAAQRYDLYERVL